MTDRERSINGRGRGLGGGAPGLRYEDRGVLASASTTEKVRNISMLICPIPGEGHWSESRVDWVSRAEEVTPLGR